jgi:hypothetical protein
MEFKCCQPCRIEVKAGDCTKVCRASTTDRHTQSVVDAHLCIERQSDAAGTEPYQRESQQAHHRLEIAICAVLVPTFQSFGELLGLNRPLSAKGRLHQYSAIALSDKISILPLQQVGA